MVSGSKVMRPTSATQRAAVHALARLLRPPPRQREFVRMQAQPAIRAPAIAEEQIARDLASLAKTRDQRVAVRRRAVGGMRHLLQTRPNLG
ncbi:MAG: hypothetical protein OHK0018_11600 [Erythrobacter tepidarius]